MRRYDPERAKADIARGQAVKELMAMEGWDILQTSLDLDIATHQAIIDDTTLQYSAEKTILAKGVKAGLKRLSALANYIVEAGEIAENRLKADAEKQKKRESVEVK